jgi:hypothetical protein
MRSKALGIATTPKPAVSSPKKSVDKENKKSESNARITEMTRKATAPSSPRKSSSNEIVRASSNNTTRTVSSKTTKEDGADVAVEINITSNQNIQVSNKKTFQ